MDRGRVQVEAQFVFRLQTVGGFGGKSDQLNAYNILLRDPGYFDRDMQRYLSATATSLRETTGRYLDAGHHVTLSIVPSGRLDLAMPDSRPADVS
jgi:zinc protease